MASEPGPLSSLMLADLEGFENAPSRYSSLTRTREGLVLRGLVSRASADKDRLTVAGQATLDAVKIVREILRRRIEQLEEVQGLRERAAIDEAAVAAAELIG